MRTAGLRYGSQRSAIAGRWIFLLVNALLWLAIFNEVFSRL